MIFHELPDGRPTRVVAVLFEGDRDGTARATQPIATVVTREGPYVSSRLLRFPADLKVDGSNLRFGYDERGRRVSGILLLGIVGPDESDEAAVRRCAVNVPDVVAIWRAQCRRRRPLEQLGADPQ